MAVMLLLVYLLCVVISVVSSFSPPSRRQQQLRFSHRQQHDMLYMPTLYAASTTLPSSSTSNSILTIQETSNELLNKLQQKAAGITKKDTTLLDDNEINSLVRTLIDSKTTFNPSTCINGPLFASVHFIGDTPLWEKIGASVVRNVKGQKYTFDTATSGTFVNYAEILGNNFYLKAVGNCNDVGPVTSSSSSASDVQNEKTNNNPLGEAFASLFSGGSKMKQQSTTNLPTPYDYSAQVTGASIVLFQKFSLDLTIEGTGTVRVLFADENLRIFLSPKDTNVTRGAEGWESEGLIVVQVRVGLVYDDWIDTL